MDLFNNAEKRDGHIIITPGRQINPLILVEIAFAKALVICTWFGTRQRELMSQG